MSLNDAEWHKVKKEDDEFFKGSRAVLLDVMHHDTPERHVIGGTLLAPNLVRDIGTPTVGHSPAVAREDHVHGDGGTNAAWVAYTPLVSSTGTPPNLGVGGSQLGRYFRIGKLVFYQFRVVFGSSGVSAGSGTYSVTIPATADQSFWGARTVGTARGYNPGSGQYFGPFNLVVASATVLYMEGGAAWPSGGLSYIGGAFPWTWGVNMEFHGTCFYEAA